MHIRERRGTEGLLRHPVRCSVVIIRPLWDKIRLPPQLPPISTCPSLYHPLPMTTLLLRLTLLVLTVGFNARVRIHVNTAALILIKRARQLTNELHSSGPAKGV